MWKFWKNEFTPEIPKCESPKRDSRSQRFEQVESLLRGIPTQSNQATLLFFTVHKAASSFVGRLLNRVASAHQIIPVDYLEYMSSEATAFKGREARLILESVLLKPLPDDEPQAADFIARKPYELSRMFPSSGFFFGPLRAPYLLEELPNLDQYRTLIQLRDPRDCLTSMYFSKAFSHVPPADPEKQQKFFEERQQVQEETIDEYVVDSAPRWLRLYQNYAEALQNSPRLQFVKYEQMVLDFPGWLTKVEEAWGFDFNPQLRERLLKEADFDVKQEDIYSHKRQVMPGDHLRKLKPETVEQLTEMFRPSLEALGYPLQAEVRKAA